ncbi:acyl-CoA desaturase [Nonomuraea rubra]|uniref:acyl-CoA desaturase n=1 Tax=Nonomuraea rubra TaxID=46180 RepID=UPI003616A933
MPPSPPGPGCAWCWRSPGRWPSRATSWTGWRCIAAITPSPTGRAIRTPLPVRHGTARAASGLAHAHLGWLFADDPTPAERYAPDLLADPAMRRVARAFPALCALSLALPFLAGWAITGTLYGALTAFLWAGLIRIALLQHVTWSVNSLCHVIGARPFKTRRHDRSTNLWPLALLSFGESWHNGHHSEPSCARHGLNRGQFDPSAAVIGLFERLGWAGKVHWPDPERIQRRRAGPQRQAHAPTGD